MSPVEFWTLTPGQVWWVIRAHKHKTEGGKQEQNAELYRLLKESRAREKAGK